MDGPLLRTGGETSRQRRINFSPLLFNKKPIQKWMGLYFVQAERLELSHLAALDPKSSVSTNSTTPAFPISNWDANIMQIFNSLNFPSFKNVLFCIFKIHPKFAPCKTYKITFQKTNKGS